MNEGNRLTVSPQIFSLFFCNSWFHVEQWLRRNSALGTCPGAVADKWLFMTNWSDFTLVLLSRLASSGVTLCPVTCQKTSCCCAARILVLIYCRLFSEFVDATLSGTDCRKVLVVNVLMLILKQRRQVTTLYHILQNPTFKDKLLCSKKTLELLW